MCDLVQIVRGTKYIVPQDHCSPFRQAPGVKEEFSISHIWTKKLKRDYDIYWSLLTIIQNLFMPRQQQRETKQQW